MKLFRTARELKKEIDFYRRRSLTIGFVPTMGALHAGHTALVRAARRENDRVVVSIFVNPTQFGPQEDLARYPRPFARDKKLLTGEKTDVLFAPSAHEMYPKGFQTRVTVGPVAELLCGKSRPGHFSGVATVVVKLLGQARPDRLYLGQKDYQQVRVLARAVHDLSIPVQIRMVSTVRGSDGLALSSRNVFLTAPERREAVGLYKALTAVQVVAGAGETDVNRLKNLLKNKLRALKIGRLDYAEILDAETLEPMVKLSSVRPAVAACAVFYSKARLIDNVIIQVPKT